MDKRTKEKIGLLLIMVSFFGFFTNSDEGWVRWLGLALASFMFIVGMKFYFQEEDFK